MDQLAVQRHVATMLAMLRDGQLSETLREKMINALQVMVDTLVANGASASQFTRAKPH